ncbi:MULTISPECIES: Hsp20/alpha crystallin family protein [unclassified Breznakia]|uniref:Hsp20/alpha crystallin family protein n=1 Tax=unclassified Breznakia TaxID=2623764 RepID=UPI002474C0CD|nr:MULTISPECIES: Hsp20/alpha crystallin family protein [unclassified Breznakia]MDH6367291.1 HSP20 family protein [Breznakia sp. PH1-1]MDH6404470.1 HSP20 family protein [Breznakia sp. PF1-11]MDH6412139.1 HSP20 family protein [Breznakia sp. PFB1-11]MDH6414458.1 HSP20 family protein [Breznakia sp. PFB1-14]MDH6416843.1 HSP20 family protein [Breznakia sp. PFB1-4]
MKLLPGFSLFDDVFDDNFFRPVNKTSSFMKTDIREVDGNYVLDMELPGYNKEDIKIALKDGYLTVTATRNDDKEDKDDKGNVVRRERFAGTCTRSFYVSDAVTEEDIKAKYDNGELHVTFPKDKPKEIAESKPIAIE